MTDTQLLFLPADAREIAVNLHVTPSGEILSREEVLPLSTPPAAARGCVLVVPASLVGLHRRRLVASSPAQAAAAGLRLVEDQLAVPREQLHVAVSARDAGDERWVAVVSPEQMRAWIEQARTLGFRPVSMVPDCLLLAAPEREDVTVLASPGLWRVRAQALAFSAEPALAQSLLTGKNIIRVEGRDQVECEMAARAVGAPLALDLLQQAFACNASSMASGPAWRRAAILAAAALLLPLMGWSAQAMRHELAINAIESKASAALAAVSVHAGGDRSAFIRANGELARLRAQDAFSITTDALFSSLPALSETSITAMEFGEDGVLAVTLAHPEAGDVAVLRELLATRGIDLAEVNTTGREDGLQSELLMSISP